MVEPAGAAQEARQKFRLTDEVMTMVAENANDILLLALGLAYAGQPQAFVMIEHVERAIRKCETGMEKTDRISHLQMTLLIQLESLGLIRIVRGRILMTEAGLLGCQDMQLPPQWSGLPASLKAWIRISA